MYSRKDDLLLISRPLYMKKLREASGTPEIKILTGIRRCGKSTLLQAFADELRAQDENTNLIEISFERAEFEELTDRRRLYQYVEGAYAPGARNIVMIDEVQMCQDFEKTIGYLHASGKYDLYLTGSNAFLQSSDLATLFTGRTFDIPV